jgi:hypothetical protein
MALLNQFLEAQRRFQQELLSKSGVVGVGIGYKNVESNGDSEMALVAMVEQKKPKEALRDEDLVPPDIDGAKTDVIEVGIIRAQVNSGPKDQWRPLIPSGVSIAHYLVTAGTFGILVYDTTTGEPLILSNNHVLANSNDSLIGDAILQPGPTDGGKNPADAIAKLWKYAKLTYIGDPFVGDPNPIISSPTTPTPTPIPIPTPEPSGCATLIVQLANAIAKANDPNTQVQITRASESASKFDPYDATTIEAQAANAENQLDAALAAPVDASMLSGEILKIGAITGTKPASLSMPVRKFGRTTGYTEGTITLINATVDVGYSTQAGKKTARFVGQVMTTSMSQGGDSGSLIVEQGSQNAIGLLFAGSGSATIFTPIDRVLNKLSVVITKP